MGFFGFAALSTYAPGGWADFHSGMSPDYGIGLRGGKDFKDAGVGNGSTCSRDLDYGTLGVTNACDPRCAVDSNQFCGGAIANSVFSTGR
ncbi:MAG: hypothetical protein IAE86_18070 [Burkholderiaceae bacterium]|nr:hypothetical protein [Burkholderiaceae bacterium]